MGPTNQDLDDGLDYEGEVETVSTPPTRRRQVGRVVPRREEISFEVKINGEVVGEVFPHKLTGSAQIDLEDAQSTRQLARWLKMYAGGDEKQVIELLRESPLDEISNFAYEIATALQKSIALGNERRQRSRLP